MRFVNKYRDILYSGRVYSHAGNIYKADLAQRKVYKQSVSDYIAKADTWTQCGLIGPDGTIRRTGNKFKSLREAAGVPLSEVARQTGIPQNTLVNYDLNQRSICLAPGINLFYIARYFGVSIEELIYEDILEYERKKQ